MRNPPAKLLTFAIESRQFGIRVDQIDEVIRAVRLTPLPKAPRVVEGLIDVRGTVVPVLDSRSRFRLGCKAVEPADHIVIARANDRTVGLRVDRAIDILTVPEHEIEDVRALAPPSEYVAGVAKLPNGLLLIHDLATFLSDAEAETLDAIVAEGIPA